MTWEHGVDTSQFRRIKEGLLKEVISKVKSENWQEKGCRGMSEGQYCIIIMG